MASYLKPKRGAYSAISSTVLQSGEIFFETPNGIGNGKGRIMMGNGSNTYSALASSSKYFLDLDSTPVSYINFSGSDSTATNTFSNLAASLGSGSVTLPMLTRVLKRALYNMSAVYVALKNEISSAVAAVSWDNISGKPTTIAGYGITDALKLGTTSTTAAAGNHSHSGYIPTTRKVNNKALSSDIRLNAIDVGAVPTSRTINNKALSSNIWLNASDVSAVPTSRTINGKTLGSNITLTASDVGASRTSHTHGINEIQNFYFGTYSINYYPFEFDSTSFTDINIKGFSYIIAMCTESPISHIELDSSTGEVSVRLVNKVQHIVINYVAKK